MQDKICLTCGTSKSIIDFYKHRAICKSCMKNKREANKDKIKEYKKKYRQLSKDKINEYKRKYRMKDKQHVCCQVIPNTFIMCGEMGQYCSQQCLEKAKANEPVPKRPST